jgi:P27 family predicted phage terminase small subunit
VVTSRRSKGLPKPPAHLSADAKKWWREVVETYELESQHLRLLALAAEAWDRCQQARRIVSKEGLVVRDRHGTPKRHPAALAEENARLAFVRVLRELDLEGEPHPGYRRT